MGEFFSSASFNGIGVTLTLKQEFIDLIKQTVDDALQQVSTRKKGKKK